MIIVLYLSFFYPLPIRQLSFTYPFSVFSSSKNSTHIQTSQNLFQNSQFKDMTGYFANCVYVLYNRPFLSLSVCVRSVTLGSCSCSPSTYVVYFFWKLLIEYSGTLHAGAAAARAEGLQGVPGGGREGHAASCQ